MPYTYTVATIDYVDSPVCYTAVEKGVWKYANGGTWAEPEFGKHVLTMGGERHVRCTPLRI